MWSIFCLYHVLYFFEGYYVDVSASVVSVFSTVSFGSLLLLLDPFVDDARKGNLSTLVQK